MGELVINGNVLTTALTRRWPKMRRHEDSFVNADRWRPLNGEEVSC